MDRYDVLRELAERQHGVVARRQAWALGLDDEELAQQAATEWAPYGERVLRRKGAPVSDELRVIAAVLDAGPGAVLSHTSAAAWWGLPGFDLGELHVTRPRNTGTSELPRRGERLAVVHETRFLPGHQLTEWRGVPVSRPTRVIFELAGQVHPGRVARALDNAWSRRLLTGEQLHRYLEELARRGRPGIRVMRALLAERGVDYEPPDSGVEGRFYRLWEEYGMGPYERHVRLGDEEGFIGEVDLLQRSTSLVCEVDSALHHAALLDAAADARRDERLRRAGYTVVRVEADEVWFHPAELMERIRAVRAAQRRAA